MYCAHCGVALSPGAKFCRECGTSVSVQPELVSIEQRTSVTLNKSVAPPDELIGVKGWLLVLCVILTIVSPALSLFGLIAELFELVRAQEGPYAQYVSTFRSLFFLNALVVVPMSAFSIYAGISLWRVKPTAVRTAKTFFVTMLLLGIFFPFVLEAVSDLPRELHNAMTTDMAKDTGRAATSFVIWFWYLHKSKRVHATYSSIAVRDDRRTGRG